MVRLRKVGLSLVAEVVLNERARANLIVDSGANALTISSRLAKSLQLDLKNAPKLIMKGVTGQDYVSMVMLSSVRVGTAKAADVVAAVYDSPYPQGIDGLLGMTFLKRFNFSIDQKNAQLMLTSRAADSKKTGATGKAHEVHRT